MFARHRAVQAVVSAAALVALLGAPAPTHATTDPPLAPPAAASAKVAPPAKVALRGPLKKVLTKVNKARARHGRKPLKVSACLTNKVAQPWARHMARTGRLEHRNLSKIFELCPGFSTVGENIAYGYPTAAAVMKAWMHSEGHRANILRKSFHRIGLGLVTSSNGTKYWVQDFGG